MKDVGKWWTEADWINVMASCGDKTVLLQEHLAYYDGSTLKHFFEEYGYVFLNNPKGTIVNEHESFERVISHDGTSSLSEDIVNSMVGIRSLSHWKKFGEWMTGQ